ncbi:MAG: hypothetical protein LQ351_002715 [Letrouitia transgressa]|nr:MAG: hypothetical protein LQ351_002715 [Letrouitia transgressa]
MLGPVQLTIIALSGTLFCYAVYHKIVFLLSSRKFARQYACKPARADRHWDPILGLDFVWSTIRASRGKYQLEDLQDRFSRISHTFTSDVLGDKLVFTDEPKNAQAVLATQFHDFDIGELRRQATVKLLGHGIFNADGAYWQHSRALIRPNFVKKQVADFPMMERHVQHMMSHLPGDGSPVDIQSFFFRMTLDTATEFLFGRSIDSLRPDATEESKRFSWAFDYSLGSIAQKMRLGKFQWMYQDRKYNEACRYIHNYVSPIIADAVQHRKEKNFQGSDAVLVSGAAAAVEAKKAAKAAAGKVPLLSQQEVDVEKDGESDERYVFLYELAKQTGNEKELRDQIINTLIAGRDTTASLMSSTLFMLSRRPDVWSKLQAEVQSTLNGKSPTFEQIKEMKYLRNVLHEVLRLFPVVPINAKFANKDTTLPRGGGPKGDQPMFVQKGQMIIWVIYSMHRREDLWGSDAAAFKPERWDGLQAGFNFLPFNGGPRICPGQQFALTEASYTLIRLCQTFDRIECVQEEKERPWVESLNLTCAVTGGVNVRCWK